MLVLYILCVESARLSIKNKEILLQGSKYEDKTREF